MSINKEIRLCANIMYSSNVNDQQLKFVESKLKKLLSKSDSQRDCGKIYTMLGKLYLVQNNYLLAKEQFLNAKKFSYKLQGIYHGLFKVDVALENYESANDNLEKFISLDKESQFNLDLYKLLLDRLLDEENNYQIDDVFYYNKLSGKNLVLYLNAIKFILDEQYDEACKLFEELYEIDKVEKLYIDFSSVIKLLNGLNKKKFNDIEFTEKKSILEDGLWNDDKRVIKGVVVDLMKLSLNDKQIKKILHDIPSLVYIDEYDSASHIIYSIRQKDVNNKYSRMTSFYDRLVNELKAIYDLQGEEKDTFQTLLRNGLDAFNDCDYGKALNYFTAGSYKTNIPLFNYYVGKTLYMIGDYKQARRNLNLYNDGGAYKIYNCKHYLSIIDLRFGKKGKSLQLASDAEYFAKLLNKDYKSSLKQFKDMDDKRLEQLFELIDMSEEDFIDREKVLKK